jgi:hypothetical protein
LYVGRMREVVGMVRPAGGVKEGRVGMDEAPAAA